jgi:DNA-binding transcriptional LysR family regulator
VVSAPVLFGRMQVSDVLCAYLARYPEVRGELLLTDRIVNLVDEGVDIAVRIGELGDSRLIARRVGATRRVLVAAPGYLADAPPLRAPRDLQRHQLIAFTALAPGREWSFQRDGREVRVAVRPRYLTNSADAAIQFARRGGGLTLALAYQVADAIRAGQLRVVLSGYEPPASPIHLVYPTTRLLSPRVRLFVEQVTGTCRWSYLRFGEASGGA